MDKLTAIKIKYDDGTYSDEIPVSVLSENVEWDNTHTLVDVLGSIDVDVTGTIQDQISQLFNEKVSQTALNNYIASQLNTDVTNWLNTNVNPVGSAVIVDNSLSIAGAAADAQETGNIKNNVDIIINEIPELKEDLETSQTEISLTWEEGALDTTTGEPITGSTNAKRTASFIPTSNTDDITKTGSPGITIFYYNYDENSNTYIYTTRVWIPAGTAYSVNKNYTHFKLTIVAVSITGLSVRGHIELYNYAHALEPRIQSNETAITVLDADIDFINAKLDGMIPTNTYTGIIISENFSGSPFDAIEIDTSDSTADLYVCGKNIYPKYPSGNANGLSWTVAENGMISFSGTPTADTFLRLQNLYFPVENVECSFAFFNNMTNSRLSFFGVNALNAGNYQLNLTSENTVGTTVFTRELVEFRLRIPKDIDWTGLTIKPMFVIGSATGEFEAYKGGKTAVTLTDGKVNETVTTLSGTNTVWSNKGNITVTVASGDLIDYINSNLEEIRYSGGFYKFTQSNNASYLNIYFKSGENFIGYELHNVPAPASNSNTWQLGHTVAYKFDGTNLSDAIELIEGGEYELAMRENGAADYCGGNNHGDENTVSFKLFIDGEQITDLSAFATGEYKTFNRIDAFDISLVDRCTDGGGTAGDYIARHQKHWTFEGGKVEIQQTLKFLQNLRLDVVLLCMCCAKRSQFPYGIRQGAVEIEDMSTSGFPHITTRGNDASYFYFGNNATINIKAKTDSPT